MGLVEELKLVVGHNYKLGYKNQIIAVSNTPLSKLKFRLSGGTFDKRKVASEIDLKQLLILKGSPEKDLILKFLRKLFNRVDLIPELDQLVEYLSDYTSWMSKFDQLSLSQLVLPGTHNSAAYQFIDNTPVGSSTITQLSRIGPLNSFLHKQARCQNDNIKQQLLNGIRYLDLRLSFLPTKGEYYLSHSYPSITLVDCIDQINYFTSKFPTEILVVEIDRDSESSYNPSDPSFLYSELLNINHRAHQEDITNLPIFHLINTDQRVIVVGEGFYPSSSIEDFWANTSDLSILRTQVMIRLERTINAPLKKISLTLTPQTKDIVKSLLGEERDPEGLAKLSSQLLREIKFRKGKLQILALDFADDYSLPAMII